MNLNEYKGVWVYAEQRDGELQKIGLELLGKAREIADGINEELTAVLLGNNMEESAKELLAYGADKVIYVEDEKLAHFTTDAFTEAICDLIEKDKPGMMLVGATYLGRDLGPRIAARVGTGLTADCTALATEEGTGHLMMTRPAFGGNLMATIMCTDHRPQMATVRPGVFDMIAKDESRVDAAKIDKRTTTFSADVDRIKVLDVIKELKDTVDLTEAQFIVSGGRGVGSAENFEILKELAHELGGTVAGSRASIDNGWLDHDLQVGQTGKTVRPLVYVACGISGAIQHLAGMQDSEYVIAINKDADAPIHGVADLSLIGDLNKLVPEFTAQLKAMNQ
ncbi:electron transfer flavoprotein alpha subunit apoprotein [Dethiosulfatibacter aminovorans DSM 17477]|uniref:Electron transfer flavoprotein alpha subunit apoprotein n=1 Tax=Dethiosulfatibacter aminovorans DSM 17477 TaxID=1121476 RepID=A0A1M6HER8_9FIRM|nr:electron transfer flavoprotein subunit alpha/FixB family protein [Dethiosulfatibacter aminovorans]SHJ20609.1 electron transfer flavoprotein alpha subunit apoprotein [Dethiosulfatibacter aminovorans DSM 17477]